jgi:hypothetical protein
MGKIPKRLSPLEANALGFEIKPKMNDGTNRRYQLTSEQIETLLEFREFGFLELKKQTKNKNGETISETYAKKQIKDDINTDKFLPKSFTTNPFGEGKWIKYDLANEERLKNLKTAIEALKEEITPTNPTPQTTKILNQNIINQYTLTDYHLGMMAWAEESGDDWDLKIAEDTIVRFFEVAMANSPDAEECIFAQIGDFLHWDGLDAVTPTNKQVLDADTRFTKVVRVAIRVLRRIITILLNKYKVVHIVMAEGNHDPASSVWLREMFSAFYDYEPRLVIDTNPDPYYCITFGKVCLFYHHTHKKPIGQLDNVFVSKFKKEFGESEHVYAHTGHLHHLKVIESNLMVLEQHRTLAAKDSYSSRGGYGSGRDSKVITYHKDYGEVGRQIININMLK